MRRKYLEIQVLFALKVAEVKQIPRNEALLCYTSIRRHIGIKNWEGIRSNSLWKKYIQTIQNLNDPREIVDKTYDFPCEFNPGTDSETDEYFGCFKYTIEDEHTIEVHFRNNEKEGISPLSKERKHIRLKELKRLFAHVKSKHPEIKYVWADTWLCNLDAWNRLFPEEFSHTLNESDEDWYYGGASLWGQFRRYDGTLKEDLVQNFVESIGKAETMDELNNSFPFKTLSGKGSIDWFYDFYDKILNHCTI
ncbi:hypothetical protein GF357_03295 [Candidatus Dojkabacteria bacterium]|nr:hypothetical protein [Candidatus Dojkabacteria bacterium]